MARKKSAKQLPEYYSSARNFMMRV
jgi:hypothetical protein